MVGLVIAQDYTGIGTNNCTERDREEEAYKMARVILGCGVQK